MPHLTYLTTGTIGADVGSYTSSATYSKRDLRSQTETGNFRNQSENKMTIGISFDETHKYTNKPFSGMGQGVPFGYQKSEFTREESYHVRHTVRGRPPANPSDSIYGTSETYITEDGQAIYSKSYTAPKDPRLSTSGESPLGANGTTRILQVTDIEYTTDGYTTSERATKGGASYFITRETIQMMNNRGAQVEGETYITSSSWDKDYQGTIIVLEDASKNTQTFEVGRKYVDANGKVIGGYETITATTKFGNTILKCECIDLNEGITPMVVLKPIPYRQSDKLGNAYEDTIYIHNKLTYTKTELYSWFSDQEPPAEAFVRVSDSYLFSGSMYVSTEDATNTHTSDGVNNVTLDSSTRSDQRGNQYGLVGYNGTTGDGVNDQEKADIRTTFYGFDSESRHKYQTSHSAMTLEFGHQIVNYSAPKIWTLADLESNTNGNWLVPYDTGNSTVTILSSTLIDMHSPWDKSMHHAQELTKDVGDWRDAIMATGVIFKSSAVTNTIREEEVIEIIKDQDPTNVEKFTIPEITAKKHFHKASGGAEGLPMWVQVLPTTATAQEVIYDYDIVNNRHTPVLVDTIAVYEEPTKITYVDKDGNNVDANGNQLAYFKYTATKRVTDLAEFFNLPELTTGGSAVEYFDQHLGRTAYSFEPRTALPSMWYADFVSSKGSAAYEPWGLGGDFGQFKINTASLYTIKKERKVFHSRIKKTFSSYELEYKNSRRKHGFNQGVTDDGTIGNFTAEASVFTKTARSGVTEKMGAESFYKNRVFAREGTADRPYIICHTYSTGYHGYVYQNQLRSLGTTYGGTTDQIYSAIGYFGLESRDFKAYKNPLKLTTAGYETLMGHNSSLWDFIQGGVITRSYSTLTNRTYWEAYQHTIYHDVDGWMEFCLSDYSSDEPITRLNNERLTDAINMNGCYQVVYMDNCGNSKEFGVFNSSMNMTNIGGGGNSAGGNLSYFTAPDGQGGFIKVDQYGNPWQSQSPNMGGRDPACDPYTWTFWSTYHEDTMTIEIKSSTVLSFTLKGSDIAPPYYGMQSYYGAMHHPHQRYTSGDIWLPENCWFNPANDKSAAFHGDWFVQMFRLNIGNIHNLFVGFRNNPFALYGQSPVYAYGNDTLDLQVNNQTKGHLFYQDPIYATDFNRYEHHACEDLIQPWIRSQLILSRTTQCEGRNTHLAPFYGTGLGTDGENIELYQNHPEYRNNWIDGRRVIKKFIPETKTFQRGVYATAHSFRDATSSYDDAIIMSTDKIGAQFTSDSKFLKDYLENTHYTLSTSGNAQNLWNNFDGFFYKTKSVKISTIESGADGVWRASIESQTSGTQSFSFSKHNATAKTYLSGNFILGSSDPMYYLVHRDTFPIVKPNCCGCKTYNTFNEDKWTQGAVVDAVVSDIGGQYRLRHENVIGGHLTIAMLPVCSYVDFDSIGNVPLPYRLYKKHMSQNTWTYTDINANPPPAGGSDFITLNNEIISYEVPDMYLMHPHKPFGVELEQHKTFTIDYFFHIRRPCIYDEYERIGVDVNIKDAYLNAHMQQSFMGSFVEVAEQLYWSEYPEQLIERRIKRNQSTKPYHDDYSKDVAVFINDTHKARLGIAQPEQAKHWAIGFSNDKPIASEFALGIDYELTSAFNNYTAFHNA